MLTVHEWMTRLETKSYEFLVAQTREPLVWGIGTRPPPNGVAYNQAVLALIAQREAPPPRPRAPPRLEAEEQIDPSRVEIVPYGGKGGTIRIVHPK